MTEPTDLRHISGHAAELFVAARIAERGFTVSKPLLTQCRYDLIYEGGGHLWTLQVKKATWSKAGNYSYLQARLSRDKRRLEPNVDYFAFTDMQKVWIIHSEELVGMTSVCLGSTKPGYTPRSKLEYWEL